MCTVVHETCETIALTLMETYIILPSGEELKNVVDGFESNLRWLTLSAPEFNHTDYCNRKQ